MSLFAFAVAFVATMAFAITVAAIYLLRAIRSLDDPL